MNGHPVEMLHDPAGLPSPSGPDTPTQASGDGACFDIVRPAHGDAPLVFASPHSGRDYSPDFLAATRLAPLCLRRSEDSFLDEIVAGTPSQGATTIAARFPRAFCDANREAWELDPGMFSDPLPGWVNTTSPRVRAGLGTIARVVGGGETIYAEKLPFAEAERRVRCFWQPYHDALSGLLEGLLDSAGRCLLVDCHSMPAHACEGRRPLPDVVLGDAFGSACAPGITQFIEQFFTSRGYQVRRNDPYAGGFITRHYGRPQRRLHAIQVEFARALYMDEATLVRRPGLATLAADMTHLAAALARDLDDMTAGD
jgi:N-formylglutamate deformylase